MIPNLDILDRMALAVARVRDRLSRATEALEAAKVPCAVIGGNAVAAWVATIDASAVRNTPNVDILVRRSDLEAASAALIAAGFCRRESRDFEVFLDGPQGTPRDAVRLAIAGEKVRPEYAAPAPDVTESERVGSAVFRVISLEPLVRMKLASFRDIDQVHLLDMIEIGLIDASWTNRFPPELAARLQQLIDTPEQ